MTPKREFGLLNSVGIAIDYGNFQSWTECICALWYDWLQKLPRAKEQNVVV